MKLSKIAEISAAVGAAALAGVNTFRHEQKRHEHRKSLFTQDHLALYSSLIAAGLALWEIKKHRRLAA